ncbi:hypothetical protein [Luteolibacter sp. LG18]|uniref:hypothetical protein n=1 Tax=Luteolibacter sp. LG18 TaxID=2819286 RepID=UPI0030C76B77
MAPNDKSSTIQIRVLYGAAVLAMVFGMLVLLTNLKWSGPRPAPDYGVPVGMGLILVFAIAINTARALGDQQKRIEELERRLSKPTEERKD